MCHICPLPGLKVSRNEEFSLQPHASQTEKTKSLDWVLTSFSWISSWQTWNEKNERLNWYPPWNWEFAPENGWNTTFLPSFLGRLPEGCDVSFRESVYPKNSHEISTFVWELRSLELGVKEFCHRLRSAVENFPRFFLCSLKDLLCFFRRRVFFFGAWKGLMDYPPRI